MAELRDIELIYPGVWKGMPFSNADIVEMVNNSNYCLAETQPQLSLNHSQVAPDIIHHASFGAVASFRMKVEQGCNVMLCTFRNVRKELADLLRHHYTRRSIEFWETYEHRGTGRVFRNVVFGVSFLGARMPPAVKALCPEFAVAYRDDDGRGSVRHGRGAMIIVPAWRVNMKIDGKQQFEDEPVGSEKVSDRPITPAEPEHGSPPTSALGAYFAARRAELGLTPRDVVAAVQAVDPELSVTEQTILDIESGLIVPTDAMLNVVRRFADAGSLGAYLRQAREDRNLTLEDVAVMLEITTAELVEIEDAQRPDDALLEKLAEVLGLDIEELRTRRDSGGVVEVAASAEDNSQQFADALAPVQRMVVQLKRERDEERRQRKTEGVVHFLDSLRQQYGAAQILTGPRVKNLLLRADDRVPVQFSDDAKPETELATLKNLLTDIARLGAQAVSVPRGQLTEEHGVRAEFSEGSEGASRVRQAEAYARQHNVRFADALRTVLKQQ